MEGASASGASGGGEPGNRGGDEAEARYREALAGRGLADVRPLYRELLKELKVRDPDGYREAVRRYEEEVGPAAGEADDPVRPWIRYGRWLADRLIEGRAVAVDPSGRSEDLAEGAPPPEGALLLHLPESTRRRALELAVPAEPSEYQEAARELLCG